MHATTAGHTGTLSSQGHDDVLLLAIQPQGLLAPWKSSCVAHTIPGSGAVSYRRAGTAYYSLNLDCASPESALSLLHCLTFDTHLGDCWQAHLSFCVPPPQG